MKDDRTISAEVPDATPVGESLVFMRHPGHRLRSGSAIVERAALATTPSMAQTGSASSEQGTHEEPDLPNQFTGPSFQTKRERFRFDGHKMMYHLDRVLAWQRGERFAPIHIDMGLTKFCNTACIYCYAVVQNMSRGTMIQRDPLLRFIDDCGRLGVRSIGFIGDGEPTLNPAVYDAAVLARQRGVDTSMATNGLKLDMDRAHEILRDMTWIRFNLSAGTPEGFQKIHQSKADNFFLLLDKIRSLVALRKQEGYSCTLGLQMVLIPENFDQILPEAQLGAELGVDYLVIKQCSDSEYKELGVDYRRYAQAELDLEQAEALSTSDYVVQVKWNKIKAASDTTLYQGGVRKYDVCMGTPFLSQLSGNGEVYPCGPFYGKKRFLIGNIHDQSYHDIVMGDRYWQVHEDIRTSVNVHKDCAIGCRQDYLNKFLWDLKNPPEHVNFI
ncbi:MAG: radical SAM protein [Magnetococcales bacterium]|nr:radical SAM protein [Magnetococcales bacterium]